MSTLHTQPPFVAGAPLSDADAALVLVHGRGASALSILGLAPAILPDAVRPTTAVLLPEADGGTWYPYSFLAPLAANEPWLGAAVDAVQRTIGSAVEAGIPHRRIVLAGFSQGACLALETAARTGAPLAAVAAFSGGLIGSADRPDGDKSFDYTTRLDDVPVFIGGAERDAHIPKERMERSADVLTRLGAHVTLQIRSGDAHTVTPGEEATVRALIARALG